jgi:sterol 3beta-glucosyltransferase
MKISVVSVGTRGDIQPYIALGLGLKASGHEITIGASEVHEQLVANQGLRFVKLVFPQHYPYYPLIPDCTAALEGADAVIASQYAFLMATPYCELHGIPLLPAALQVINSDFSVPPWFLPLSYHTDPESPRPPLEQVYRIGNLHYWMRIWKGINIYRGELGMAPVPPPSDFFQWCTHGSPVLYGFSPSVVPPSECGNAPSHVTGYWLLDLLKDWKPPQALVDFIEAGPPPIHIGFSSVKEANSAPSKTIIEALKRTGQRAVMVRNLYDLNPDDLPPNVYLIDDAPYEWLFAQCSLTVNHGGHGTIAHALQTGTPSVTIPTMADQPFWSMRAYKLGVAHEPLAADHLTAETLSRAIMQTLEDTELKPRAAALSARIRAEDGVGNAVQIINGLLNVSSPSQSVHSGNV